MRSSAGYARKPSITNHNSKYHSDCVKSKRPIPFHTATVTLIPITAVTKKKRKKKAQTLEMRDTAEVI